MDELISRRDTISAMEGTNWYHINKDGQLTHGANSKKDEPLYKAKDVYTVLNTMPSAEPEKRTEERTETHGVCLDAIDRQAAIDVLDRNHILGQGLLNDTLDHIADAIMALSSAQPQRTGRWIDHVEDGYVECPFCHSATNCDDNISDLHFCFSCGARMEGGQE